MSQLTIAVLAYPGCFASEVYGVPDVLTMAQHVAAGDGATRDAEYDVAVVSPRRRVVAAGDVPLATAPLRPTDVLIVPGFELPSAERLDAIGRLRAEREAIRAAAESGAAIVSICVGAFLLADAGLLDGRTATTSWLYAGELARRHPGVDVRPDELVVTDRGVTTTAAFSAMYDLALGLVRDRDGERIARSTARIALLDDARSAQTPYVDTELLPPAGQEFAAEVKRWLERRMGAPYDLEALARAVHVSSRTLLRRFGEQTGQTPLTYLQSARIRRARQLLETTDRTVARIASDVGYSDAGSLGTLFVRHTGRTPRDYRVAFQRRSAGRTSGGASGRDS